MPPGTGGPAWPGAPRPASDEHAGARELGRLPTAFWIGLVLVLAFGGFCTWLTIVVGTDRAAVTERVRWLERAQELEQRVRAVEADADGAAGWRALAEDVARLARDTQAAGLDGPLTALAPAFAEPRTKAQLDAVAAALDRFVRGVRRDNGMISARIGGRWDLLSLLIGVSLALALATLVLGVVADRRRRHAELWRRRLAEVVIALDHARRVAEQADRYKTRFLANVSHEIRTPLNGVLGMAELLAQDGLTPSQRERVDIIRASGETLMRVVNDILDLAKIEVGQLTIERTVFDPKKVVEETVALMQPRATQRGLSLVASCDASLPRRLVGDPARVSQILGNLVTNAVKFTERGSVTVRAGAREAGADVAELWIEVADTGPGIAPSDAEALFVAFARLPTGPQADSSGSGLGLAICKQLVELMGGRIEVTSTPGQGATFRFTLPCPRVEAAPTALDYAPPAALELAPTPAPVPAAAALAAEAVPAAAAAPVIAPPEAAPATAPPEAAPANAPPEAPSRVLVAEDHAINRMLIGAMLDHLGVPHDLVADGLQAVARATGARYRAILMDCAMPELDGLEATRRIRAAGLVDTPIIALTASVTAEDRERCAAAGMNGHLCKPLTLDDLRRALARWA